MQIEVYNKHMQFLRKLGLGLALFLYMPLLLLLPTFISLNATIIKPTFVKTTLKDSGIYEGLSNLIIEQATKNPDTANNVILITSLKQAVTPEALQKIIEPPIDSIYKWLDDPSQKFDVSVSTKPLKDSFVQIAGQNIEKQVTGLPPCSSRVVTITDPTQMTCIPKGADVQQIIAQAKAQVTQNVDTFNTDQQDIPLAQTDQTQPENPPTQATNATETVKQQTPKIDVEKLKFYAKIYHWIKVGTPVLIVLTVLSTLGIILLSNPRVLGARRVGVYLIISGVFTLGTAVVLGLLIKTFLPTPAAGESLSAAGSKAADIVAKQVISINRTFTLIYLASGVAAIVAYIVLKKVTKKPVKPAAIEKENMVPDDKDLGEKTEAKSEQKPKPVEEKPQDKKEESSKETKIDIT